MKALSPLATSGATRPATMSHPKRMASEGNYVGVQKKRVFLSTHRSLALTEGKRHTKKRSDLKLKQDDFFSLQIGLLPCAAVYPLHCELQSKHGDCRGDISAVFGRSGTRAWDPRSTGKGYCVEGDGRKAS
jgi:hypothetical protein